MRKFIVLLLSISAVFSAFASDNIPEPKKTIAFLGDSYVKNHKRPFSEAWHAKASANIGLNYVNCGRNGSCIAFDRTDDGFGPAMTERYKTEIPDSTDCIVIIAGHNDADYIRKHGEQNLWNDFCNGLDTLLDGLHNQYPNAKIAFVTPWAVDRQYFPEVTNQIIKACLKRGIPVLDMAAMGVIEVNNPEFRAKYFQGPNDTAHLNSAGHDLLVPLGEAFLQLLDF